MCIQLSDGTQNKFHINTFSNQLCKLASLDPSLLRDEDSCCVIPEGFPSCDWNFK